MTVGELTPVERVELATAHLAQGRPVDARAQGEDRLKDAEGIERRKPVGLEHDRRPAAPNLGSALENTYRAPFRGQLARKRQAGETGADDYRIETYVLIHRLADNRICGPVVALHRTSRCGRRPGCGRPLAGRQPRAAVAAVRSASGAG